MGVDSHNGMPASIIAARIRAISMCPPEAIIFLPRSLAITPRTPSLMLSSRELHDTPTIDRWRPSWIITHIPNGNGMSRSVGRRLASSLPSTLASKADAWIWRPSGRPPGSSGW